MQALDPQLYGRDAYIARVRSSSGDAAANPGQPPRKLSMSNVLHGVEYLNADVAKYMARQYKFEEQRYRPSTEPMTLEEWRKPHASTKVADRMEELLERQRPKTLESVDGHTRIEAVTGVKPLADTLGVPETLLKAQLARELEEFPQGPTQEGFLGRSSDDRLESAATDTQATRRQTQRRSGFRMRDGEDAEVFVRPSDGNTGGEFSVCRPHPLLAAPSAIRMCLPSSALAAPTAPAMAHP